MSISGRLTSRSTPLRLLRRLRPTRQTGARVSSNVRASYGFDLHFLSTSTHSDCELVLNHCRDEQLRGKFEGCRNFRIGARINLYRCRRSQPGIFRSLENSKGRGRVKGPGPQLKKISCFRSPVHLLGIVAFRVELRGAQGAPEGWWVKAGLLLELGQLPQIARKSNAFFSAAPP